MPNFTRACDFYPQLPDGRFISGPDTVVAFHRETGPAYLHLMDANEAVQMHPDVWSATPWKTTVYGRTAGAVSMPESDARELVAKSPAEWSMKPWQ
jgi:hypothetical protein